MIDRFFDGGEAGQRFSFAEAGVHEESGALCLQQGDVAGATRSQDGYAQADRFPQERKQILTIIARGGKRFQRRLPWAENHFGVVAPKSDGFSPICPSPSS